MNKDSRIYISGHSGLLGSTIKDKLRLDGYSNLIYRTHKQLDLTDQFEANRFFCREQPEYVFMCAAKVGGITANAPDQAGFLYENMMMQLNVFRAARNNAVKKLLFFGSSCIYPKGCQQPMKEEYLLQGPPEPTNEGYAIAKIAGIRLCGYICRQYGVPFISCIPPNVYGPRDNFDPSTSHVISGLIVRMHKAKMQGSEEFSVWGTGNVKREFIYSEDLADAAIFLMKNYEGQTPINAGSGSEYTVKQVAEIVKSVVGYEGDITFDSSFPDGAPFKLLDSSRINDAGWAPSIPLERGINKAYLWYLSHVL